MPRRDSAADLANAIAAPKSRNEREAQSKSGGSGTTQPLVGLTASQIAAATQSSRSGVKQGQGGTGNNGSDEGDEKDKTKRTYKIKNFNTKM